MMKVALFKFKDEYVAFLDLFDSVKVKVLKRPRLFGKIGHYEFDIDGKKVILPKEYNHLSVEGAINKTLVEKHKEGELTIGEYYLIRVGGNVYVGSSKKNGSFLLTPDGIRELSRDFYITRAALLRKAILAETNPSYRVLLKAALRSIYNLPFEGITTEVL